MNRLTPATSSSPSLRPPTLQTRVLLLVDLTGYTRFCEGRPELEVAGFLRAWYATCRTRILEHGGRVVKFMGDACFATFDEHQGPAAIDTVAALERDLSELASRHGYQARLGSNIHEARVAVLADGGADGQGEDVLGAGVNHLFLMGGGVGVRITEPVYRSLPSAQRSPWTKHKPPVRYSRQD